MSPSFEPHPLRWSTRKKIKSAVGVHYKRKFIHLQKYEEDKSQETTASNIKGKLPKDPEASQEEERIVSTQHYALRPRYNRQPELENQRL